MADEVNKKAETQAEATRQNIAAAKEAVQKQVSNQALKLINEKIDDLKAKQDQFAEDLSAKRTTTTNKIGLLQRMQKDLLAGKGLKLKTPADIDEFVSSVKSADGEAIFRDLNDLRAAFKTGGINNNNEWFSELTNKIAQQFVSPIISISLSLRSRFYKGEYTYGDYFEYIWTKMLNLKKYNPDAYTPAELKADGHLLKSKNLTYQFPQYLQTSTALAIDEKLVRAAFTQGTVPAFNAFIANIMGALPLTLDNYLYDFEIKVLKQIKNTYVLKTDYPKPAYVTNEIQGKLAYLKVLIEKMRQKSIAEYCVMGKVGDTDPRDLAGTRKLVLADFTTQRLLPGDNVLIYTSPRQNSEFATLGYSTIFHPEDLRGLSFSSLNIDKAQAISGPEVVHNTTCALAKAVKAAASADPYETAYITVANGQRSTFAVMDRFRVNTTSTGVNGQLVQTVSYFCVYALLGNNLGIKVDLRTS